MCRSVFVDHDGKVRSSDREYRIVVVDALGWTPEESHAEPADTADKQRAVWDSTLPRGDCVALHPHDCTVSAPFSHTHPKPSLESLMHGTYDFVGHSAAKTTFTLPHWI